MAGVSPSPKTFTPKQGHYLAFIGLYTRLHRRPPAEADMQILSRKAAFSPPDGARSSFAGDEARDALALDDVCCGP
jgi:hypothetical protein